jgi:hypothetical protein
MINGTVLPAGGDAHFKVVLAVGCNDDKQHKRVVACVYSSETGLWGDLISTWLPSEVPGSGLTTLFFTGSPAVLAGVPFSGSLLGILLEFLSLIWRNRP